MTNLSLQEYMDAHLPEFENTGYHPIYMTSQILAEQAVDGTGFFDIENLVTLAPEALQELNGIIGGTVQTQLNKDAGSYAGQFLTGDGNPDGAAAYTSRYEAYQDTLAMGLLHDHFVVGGQEADNVADIINGSIDTFVMQSGEILNHAIELKEQIAEISGNIVERGAVGLAFHEMDIASMSDTAKTLLREAIEDGLSDANPDVIPDMELFRQQLDEHIAPLPTEEHASAAPSLAITPTIV